MQTAENDRPCVTPIVFSRLHRVIATGGRISILSTPRPWARNTFYSHQRVHIIRIDCVWSDIRNTGRNHYYLLHKQHWVFVFDRTLTIDVVFQSCGFLRCPVDIDRGCQFISGFGRHLGLTDTLGLDLKLALIRYQTKWISTQAALLWISKVRGYDHGCCRWSAQKKLNKEQKTKREEKNTQIRDIQQQNTSNALFLPLIIECFHVTSRRPCWCP